MDFARYGLFLPVCFAVAMALGPAVAPGVAGVPGGDPRDGSSPSVAASIGRLVALLFVLAIAGAIGFVAAQWPVAFMVLDLACAAYLAWIGARLARAFVAARPPARGAHDGWHRIAARDFRRAAGHPNPVLASAALVPPFVDRAGYAASVALLAGIFAVLQLVATAIHARRGH